jgi:hypothetical protein
LKLELALALTLILLPVRASATEKAGWLGPGTVSCPEFVEACRQNSKDETLFFSWALGFMSGLNTELLQHGETNLNGLPIGAQKEFIRSYCKDHPKAPYFEAVFKLFDKMRHDQGLPSYVQTWHEPKSR